MSRGCPLCGSIARPLHSGLGDRVFGVPGRWDLARCVDCGLVRLTDGEPEDAYAGYYTHDTYETDPQTARRPARTSAKECLLHAAFGYGDGDPAATWQVLARSRLLYDVAGRAVLWLQSSERGHLLDVGCGNGEYLARMQSLGWKTTGIDTDPGAVDVARREVGVDARVGTVDDPGLPGASFDAVTLAHVIEHVADPVSMLAACARLLRPGGRLVVLTPNSSSIGARLFGPDWRGWEPPRHLVVFTPKTLRRAATAAGLETDEVRTTANAARHYYLASRAIRRREPLVSGQAARRPPSAMAAAVAFWLLEHGASRLGPYGEEIVLRAHRPR